MCELQKWKRLVADGKRSLFKNRVEQGRATSPRSPPRWPPCSPGMVQKWAMRKGDDDLIPNYFNEKLMIYIYIYIYISDIYIYIYLMISHWTSQGFWAPLCYERTTPLLLKALWKWSLFTSPAFRRCPDHHQSNLVYSCLFLLMVYYHPKFYQLSTGTYWNDNNDSSYNSTKKQL